jgi:hypothetical protein
MFRKMQSKFEVSGRASALIEALTLIPVAVRSFWCGATIYMSGRAGTPLRGLCIAAFDFLHRNRHAAPLDPQSREALAALIALGALANRLLDGKVGDCGPAVSKELWATLHVLKATQHRVLVQSYLKSIGTLERGRPAADNTPQGFASVVAYREDVIRLSLGAVAGIAGFSADLPAGIRATHNDDALNALYRIVMQCQIIDDVFDYRQDRAAGLPTFLSAHDDVTRALSEVRRAVKHYSDGRFSVQSGEMLLLSVSLAMTTRVARIVVAFGGLRWRLCSFAKG